MKGTIFFFIYCLFLRFIFKAVICVLNLTLTFKIIKILLLVKLYLLSGSNRLLFVTLFISFRFVTLTFYAKRLAYSLQTGVDINFNKKRWKLFIQKSPALSHIIRATGLEPARSPTRT